MDRDIPSWFDFIWLLHPTRPSSHVIFVVLLPLVSPPFVLLPFPVLLLPPAGCLFPKSEPYLSGQKGNGPFSAKSCPGTFWKLKITISKIKIAILELTLAILTLKLAILKRKLSTLKLKLASLGLQMALFKLKSTILKVKPIILELKSIIVLQKRPFRSIVTVFDVKTSKMKAVFF